MTRPQFGVLVPSRRRLELEPVLACFRPQPSPVRLVRIGGKGDGAYLVPDDLRGIEACFSPGVENRKPFEDELASRFGCPSFMLDFSSDVENFETPLIEGLQFFEKKWLSAADGADSVSLASWVASNAPGTSDLLLQMDIEGAEYAILASAPREVLVRFRILVVEFHNFRDRLGSIEKDPEFMKVVHALSQDFVVVHARGNNCCGAEPMETGGTMIPHILELTLLRRDRFERGFWRRRHAVRVPHPKDVVGNVPFLRPLHLGGSWLERPRPISSTVKIGFDFFMWFFQTRGKYWPFQIWRWIRGAFDLASHARLATSRGRGHSR